MNQETPRNFRNLVHNLINNPLDKKTIKRSRSNSSLYCSINDSKRFILSTYNRINRSLYLQLSSLLKDNARRVLSDNLTTNKLDNGNIIYKFSRKGMKDISGDISIIMIKIISIIPSEIEVKGLLDDGFNEKDNDILISISDDDDDWAPNSPYFSLFFNIYEEDYHLDIEFGVSLNDIRNKRDLELLHTIATRIIDFSTSIDKLFILEGLSNKPYTMMKMIDKILNLGDFGTLGASSRARCRSPSQCDGLVDTIVSYSIPQKYTTFYT